MSRTRGAFEMEVNQSDLQTLGRWKMLGEDLKMCKPKLIKNVENIDSINDIPRRHLKYQMGAPSNLSSSTPMSILKLDQSWATPPIVRRCKLCNMEVQDCVHG